MRIRKPGLALVVAFASVFGLSQTASADDCEDYIEELQELVEDDLCRYSRMCEGLSHKLDNALHKMEQGKIDHAVRRLEDFSATLDSMSAAGRNSRRSRMAIDDEVHQEMKPYIAKAMVCIAKGGDVEDDDDDDDEVVSGDNGTSTGDTGGTPTFPDIPF